MSHDKKYPPVAAGAFIFNDKNELLLVKSPRWHDKYLPVGGKIEQGETIIAALRREVKEETGLDISEPEFIAVTDGLDLAGKNNKDYRHLIFIDFMATAQNGKVRLNGEHSGYKWLTLEEWLIKDEGRFGPYVYPVLKKIKDFKEARPAEEKYRRALADYQNLLKQTAKEKAEFAKYANTSLLYDLLPVYDNLKLSLKHLDKEADKNGWAEGIKHIAKQFKDALLSAGVEEIAAADKKFDPSTMEAVEKEKTDKKDRDGIVAKEVKPGYKLNGKVIIPARVAVYKFEE
jgi:molecular chaperone GrpE (heat shock protein)/8-oxo-dGTP pyrophosphatase MutT (NUDIX family)